MSARASNLTIRAALQGDLPALVRIYNHYVTTTFITFDTEPFTLAQRQAWFDEFSASGPYRLLVAQIGGEPAGYASEP